MNDEEPSAVPEDEEGEVVNDEEMSVWINPLLWVESSDKPMDHEGLWRFVSARPEGPPPDVGEIAERWRHVVPDGEMLAVVPAEQGIVSRIVWPLRSAVVAFGLGDNTAAVAMCGMAAEMTTMLWWLVDNPGKDGKGAPSFARRIDKMESCGVDASLVRDLRQLKDWRRRMLHYWSPSITEEEAAECCRTAIRVAHEAVGPSGFSNGTVLFPQGLLDHLRRTGMKLGSDKWEQIRAISDTADPPASPLAQSVEMTLPDGTKVESGLLAPRQDTFPELLTVEMQEGGTIGDAVACPVAQAVNRHFDDKFVAVAVHDGYLNIYHKANVLWIADQVSIAGREAVATYSCLITPIVNIDPTNGVPRLALRRCGFTITV